MRLFPEAVHICTYDVRGTMLATGAPKGTRATGLVMHTHQLLNGLARRHPRTRLAITQTGAHVQGLLGQMRTPEGQTVTLRAIATAFPQYLRDPSTGGKCPRRVRHYYEETIDDPDNPIWWSLSGQYAHAVHAADTPNLLLQNINPIVAVLKAEQFGLLDVGRLGGLNITGVVHDGADTAQRFRYVAQRIERTGADVLLIAVSEAVRQSLTDCGVPSQVARKVLNGLDVEQFQERLRRARAGDVFARVRERNKVPKKCRIVLVSARRVPWKGHEDVVRAAHRLRAKDRLKGVCVVFNGAGTLDTRWPGYEEHLKRLIAQLGLTRTVFLLDELTQEEVSSCYTAAYVAVLASREPEPFGYANIEAMLAGVPVVATGHGGPLEYIEHGKSGLLVPPGDPAAIAAGLDVLLTDPALHARIARAGRVSAERFSLDAMVDGYEAAISRIRLPRREMAGVR